MRAALSTFIDELSKAANELSKALEDNRVLRDELIKERENSRLQTENITELASKCAELGRGSLELGARAQYLLAANQGKRRRQWRFPWTKKQDAEANTTRL